MTGNPRTAIILSVASAAVTLVAGTMGWMQVYGPDPQRDVWDVLYHTLLAFTGDGSYLPAKDEPRLNPWLQVARISGIVTTLAAIAAAVIAMLGERFLRWRAGRMKDHVVILGASPFALDIVEDGRDITVIDTPEVLARTITPSRRGKVRAITDQMIDTKATRPLLGRPSQVIFGDPDTVTNVERARQWVGQTDIRAGQIKLRIEDKTVARDLHLLSPDLAHATQISRSETIARALITSMAPTNLAMLRGQRRVHIGLIGMSGVNLAIAEELALRCHHPALEPLRLTVVDRDIAAARARIRAERPDLMNPDFGPDGFTMDFIQMNALECCSTKSVSQIVGIETRMPITALVVAAGEDTRNLAIAMRLRQLQVEKLCLKAPIYMRSDSQGSVAAARCDDLTGGIVAFGGRHLDAEDLFLERIYADLARGIHQRWRASPDVVKTPENDWDNLPAAQRRASLRAALSAVELFYAAGFQPPVGEHIGGLRLEPRCGNAALGDDAVIADLSRTEHDRWNCERRLEGFARAPDGIRDNEKKLHPLILEHHDLLVLDPAQLRKDEVNVREALFLGIERHEAAPDHDCWRKVERIGLIGPLHVDTEATKAAIGRILDDLCERHPDLPMAALEILCPNAPGFDRVAALHLALAWRKTTGRPCRLLMLNAASPTAVDQIALRHVGQGLEDHEQADLIAQFQAQCHALSALTAEGHHIQQLDMRGIGMSDARLLRDASAYDAVLTSVQNAILTRADRMIFDTANGTASWTLRALQAWEERRGSAFANTICV